LEAVVDEVGLSNVAVVLRKAGDVPDRFGACLARAFSSPQETWALASRLLSPGGFLVYWAGERFDRRAAADLDVQVRVSTRSDLARTGPLVIMGPQ
jgi:16S rRNA G527 N7-methylase RsmG